MHCLHRQAGPADTTFTPVRLFSAAETRRLSRKCWSPADWPSSASARILQPAKNGRMKITPARAQKRSLSRELAVALGLAATCITFQESGLIWTSAGSPRASRPYRGGQLQLAGLKAFGPISQVTTYRHRYLIQSLASPCSKSHCHQANLSYGGLDSRVTRICSGSVSHCSSTRSDAQHTLLPNG